MFDLDSVLCSLRIKTTQNRVSWARFLNDYYSHILQQNFETVVLIELPKI